MPLLFLLSFLLTVFGVYAVRRVLLKQHVMDIPSDRSNHRVPVPRGGGIAMVAVLLLSWPMASWIDMGNALYAYPILGAALGLAMISFLDDLSPLSVRWRLGVQAVAVAIGIYFLYGVQGLSPLFSGFLPLPLEIAVMTLCWLWFVNLYNFMDGIDGITASQTIAIALGVAMLILAGLPVPELFYPVMMLIAIAFGFLVFNWHPAKIFMGDVGSVPLGYVMGFLLLSLALHGYPIPALILPAYYLADASFTLTKRLFEGKKIWQPHSEHCYQKAVRAGLSHSLTTGWIALINGCLLWFALIAFLLPHYALQSLVFSYVLVGLVMVKFSVRGMMLRKQHEHINTLLRQSIAENNYTPFHPDEVRDWRKTIG